MRTSSMVVAALLLAAACGTDELEPDEAAGQAASEALGDVEIERVGEYTHALGELGYDSPAPSGGDHAPPPYWLTCGVYEGEVPDELAVHSLEHGAVWIALGPESTDDDRAAAEDLADGNKVLVSDVPDLPSPVELVAWGVRLRLDSADDPGAEAFIDEYIDAAGAPEPGASCESLGNPPTPPPLPTE